VRSTLRLTWLKPGENEKYLDHRIEYIPRVIAIVDNSLNDFRVISIAKKLVLV